MIYNNILDIELRYKHSIYYNTINVYSIYSNNNIINYKFVIPNKKRFFIVILYYNLIYTNLKNNVVIKRRFKKNDK